MSDHASPLTTFAAALLPTLFLTLRQQPVESVTPLGGGLTNVNYRVDVAGQSYVLRIERAGADILGIDREREARIADAAFQAGVGPEVVERLKEYGLTLTRFVRGKQLSAEDIRRPEVMRGLTQALRRCHDYPVPRDLGDFDAFAVIAAYHAHCRDRKLPLPAQLGSALAMLAAIEKEVRTAEPPCMCHNDLLAANFIDDGTAIRIIDWEYGGLTDRFFDLGNLAANSQFSPAEEQQLLQAYIGEARPEHLRRLRLNRLVSDLREATWSFVQAGNVPNPEEYRQRGQQHLDRLLTASECRDH